MPINYSLRLCQTPLYIFFKKYYPPWDLSSKSSRDPSFATFSLSTKIMYSWPLLTITLYFQIHTISSNLHIILTFLSLPNSRCYIRTQYFCSNSDIRFHWNPLLFQTLKIRLQLGARFFGATNCSLGMGSRTGKKDKSKRLPQII